MYSPRQAEIKRRVEEIRGTTTPTNPTDAAITRAKAKIKQREQAARLRRNPIAQKAQEEMERLRARRLERDPVRRAAQSALDKLHDRRMARDPAYRAYQRAKDRLNPAAAKAREQRRKEQRQGQKKAKSKDKKTPKKEPKPKKPTSITVKGAISSDVVIRHVPIGYIPDHELQKIADIEAGQLPECYPRRTLSPDQLQEKRDEIEATYQKRLAEYQEEIEFIRQDDLRHAKKDAEVIEKENSEIKKLTKDIAGYTDQIDESRAAAARITTAIEDTKAEIEHEKSRPAHEIPEDTIVDIVTIAREYDLTIDPDHDTLTDMKKSLTRLYNNLGEEEDYLRGTAPRDELEKITKDLDTLDIVLNELEDEEKRTPNQDNSDHLNELKAQLTQLHQDREEAEETQKALTQKIDQAEEDITAKKEIISAKEQMIDQGNTVARKWAEDDLRKAEEEREELLHQLEHIKERAEQEDADTIEELRRNLTRTVDEIVNKYYFEGNIFSLEEYRLKD